MGRSGQWYGFVATNMKYFFHNELNIRNKVFMFNTNFIIKIIALFFLFNISAYAAYSDIQDKLSIFDSYVKSIQKDWQVPGVSIAIVEENKIIFDKGFGIRNKKMDPVTSDTLFDIASLTKSFTTALLAIQIEREKYAWDTKIIDLYPQFKLYDPIVTKKFEVKDLIAHNSGLPPDALDALGNFGYNSTHMINSLRFIKPVNAFKTQFAYEDIFPVLAKEIIQKVSKKNYAIFLHQNLLIPLQMNNTYTVTEENFSRLENVAWPYVDYDGKVYPYTKNYPYISQKWALENGIGSGGIESSAKDIAKWLMFNMDNGAIGSAQLISVKNMNFIHSPYTKIKTSNDTNLSGETAQAYGEGWFIDTQSYKPYTVLFHAGGGTGMHALMAYIPERKIGIVILTNTWGNKIPEILYRKWFDLYLNKAYSKDWNQLFLEQRKKVLSEDNKISNSSECTEKNVVKLNKYVGTYHNSVYGNLVVSKEKNNLYLIIGPKKIKWQLIPCQKNILKAYWPNPGGMNFPMLPAGQDRIEFTIGLNDSIQKMTIPFLNDDGSGIFIKNE